MSAPTLIRTLFFSALILILLAVPTLAQPTKFSYQGRLTQAGSPANGPYDFELKLYDVENGGAPMVVQIKPGVMVTQGVFNIVIDFGPGAFPGPDRWLEVSVRPQGGGAFTLLSPRQLLLS